MRSWCTEAVKDDKSVKKCVGMLILNTELTHILLVRGRVARKWGPPKGHREPTDKSSLETAFREVFEETGLQFQAKILPSITLSKVKLYCISIPQSTPVAIQDQTEISGISWFSINDLWRGFQAEDDWRNPIIDSRILGNLQFNGVSKMLFQRGDLISLVKHKIKAFQDNYPNVIEDGTINLNMDIEKLSESEITEYHHKYCSVDDRGQVIFSLTTDDIDSYLKSR